MLDNYKVQTQLLKALIKNPLKGTGALPRGVMVEDIGTVTGFTINGYNAFYVINEEFFVDVERSQKKIIAGLTEGHVDAITAVLAGAKDLSAFGKKDKTVYKYQSEEDPTKYTWLSADLLKDYGKNYSIRLNGRKDPRISCAYIYDERGVLIGLIFPVRVQE